MSSLLSQSKYFLRAGLNALLLRPIPPPPATSAGVVVLFLLVTIVVTAAFQRANAGPDSLFSSAGIASSVATWGIVTAGFAALRRSDRPVDVGALLAVIASVALWAMLAMTVLVLAGSAFPGELLGNGPPSSGLVWLGVALWLAVMIWLMVAYFRVGRAVTAGMPRRIGLSVPVITLLPLAFIPQQPVFVGYADPPVWPTVWDLASYLPSSEPNMPADTTPRPPRIDYEAAWERQPELVDRVLADVAPSTPGKTNVYFVGAATYASQDVFKREVHSARQIVDERFGTAGRSVLLVNHRDTLPHLPLANATNLDKVLAGVGRKMDKTNDVLVLFLTSHGSKQLLSVSFAGFGLNDITPERLAAALDNSGIENRIVVISACHSGSFIPALENPGTLVMAAAHADRTSFGCSNEREWTYFGDALFNHGLRRTTSWTEAFDIARETVTGWEKAQGLTPSEPQIFVGEGIGRKLATLRERLAALP